MGEQVGDGGGQIVIGIHQAGRARDNAVAIVVGIAGEGEIVLVLERDQAGHGVGRRAIHADFAVPIDAHKAEGRVGAIVLNGELEAVAFGDARPIGQAGAAQRVGTEIEARVADGVHVEDGGQIVDIFGDVIVAVGGSGGQRALVWDAAHFA